MYIKYLNFMVCMQITFTSSWLSKWNQCLQKISTSSIWNKKCQEWRSNSPGFKGLELMTAASVPHKWRADFTPRYASATLHNDDGDVQVCLCAWMDLLAGKLLTNEAIPGQTILMNLSEQLNRSKSYNHSNDNRLFSQLSFYMK